MDKLIYTYALIKSLYDQEEDYIDCFCPFVIKSFSEKQFLNSVSIQRIMNKKFNLDIPLHVLNNILTRLMARKHISKKGNGYELTGMGKGYLNKFETDKDVDRRINALIQDMKLFFNEKGVYLDSEGIQNLIYGFISRNIKPLIEFVNPSSSCKLNIPRLDGNENVLAEYILNAEEHKPDHYNTLHDMVLGSIISVVVYAKEPSQIIETENKLFKCEIFLDTNFVLSVLGLHTPEFNDPAKELFSLLKKYEFDLKVFNFTLNEISSVVGGYIKERHNYPKNIRISSLYGSLAKKGWEKTDVIDFITNLEYYLKEKGIEVEHTRINTSTYEPSENKLRMLISRHKPLQEVIPQNHDLAAIEKVMEIRGKEIRNIEDSSALFLTSDHRLSQFNFIEMGHKENGTVCEVILDKLLTNILWLKDPSADISLKSIIESYSRDLFIKKSIWNKFRSVLEELVQKDKLKEEDVSMLLYHNYIEPVLREYDDEDINKINDEFVLKEAEKAAAYKEKHTSELIEETKEKFAEQMKEELSKVKAENKEELSKVKAENKEELSKVKKEAEEELFKVKAENKEILRKSIEKEVSLYLYLASGAMIIVALYLIYVGYTVSQSFKLDSLYTVIAIILLGGGGLTGIFKRFREYLKNPLVNLLFKRRVEEQNSVNEDIKFSNV
ncbi:hypothetical protein [Methanobacterium sp.]|uniref:hypothetical protein n=1 Tax=Methanobacterium sp. TaxID=2164 RepID=UPI003C70CCD4